MAYFIGIDGGGTSTKFALVDADLNLIGRAERSGANPNVVGLEAARSALADGVRAMLDAANVPLSAVRGIGAGLAGLDRPADHARFSALFAELFPDVPAVLDNDAIPVLYAASGRAFGIVTISGTGMIALGVNEHGERARCGGWGHYADRGSGYFVAREALHALFSAYDRGEELALSTAILAKLGLSAVSELIEWLYAPERRINDVAALAADVVRLAEFGRFMRNTHSVRRRSSACRRCSNRCNAPEFWRPSVPCCFGRQSVYALESPARLLRARSAEPTSARLHSATAAQR